MLSDFLKYIEDNRMIKKGDLVLMAVSGGIDSMVMADLFTRTSYKTAIAHCNFCLRGVEADEDENLVRKFAEKNGMTFFSKRFDTKQYAKKKGLSIQMAARELRYNWFVELMQDHGFSSTAVAHNLNDKVETMLINLTRGTGLAGLTGIRPAGNNIIRPLLFADRKRIEEYCKKNSVSYREDQTNAETKYTRNKIRHRVLPVLREINPSIEITLDETAERLSGAEAIVNAFIRDLRKVVQSERGADIVLDLRLMKQWLNNTSVLYELMNCFGVTGTMLKDLINIIGGRTGTHIDTTTHRILKNRNELIISHHSEFQDEPYILSDKSELAGTKYIKSIKSVNITLNFNIQSDPFTAYLDEEKLAYPLSIRKWHAGDFFYPLGMKQKKKLSDYFTDRKYSMRDKERALILESEGKIVWLIGERIDERYKITKGTKKAIIIKARDYSDLFVQEKKNKTKGITNKPVRADS